MGFSEELDAHDAAQKRQAEASRAQEAEAQRQARALIQDFVKTARERGIPTAKVRTQSEPNVTYRTKTVAWELRALDGRYCITPDGEMYSLHVDSGLFKDKSPRRLSTVPLHFTHMDGYETLEELLFGFLQRNSRSR